MEILEFVANNIVLFLIVLTVLVYVHEMGHYLVARWNGVRVEVFSIGFGPEIYGWNDKHGTRWKISAIPLGGYVKMFGDTDAASMGESSKPMTAAERKVAFHHKKLGWRTAIVAAGPFANIIFAFVVYAVLFVSAGAPTLLPVVGEVVDDSVASSAGFQAGDRIVEIDGKEIKYFSDLYEVVSQNPDRRLSFLVERKDAGSVPLTATPKPVELPAGGTIGRLGVAPDPAKSTLKSFGGPVEAVSAAGQQTYGFIIRIFQFIGGIFAGTEDSSQVGGPIGIAKIIGDTAEGGWWQVIMVAAALSINLGLINLFPIPLLDGGHLVFYAVEAVRGRALSAKAQEFGFKIGLGLVLLLLAFATWNDIAKLFESGS